LPWKNWDFKQYPAKPPNFSCPQHSSTQHSSLAQEIAATRGRTTAEVLTFFEINFLQSRSAFTNLFTGWHLITQDNSGEGTDNNGVKHAVDYSNQSIFFSLGYDWYLSEFAHLQPYIAYGLGSSTYSATDTAADGTITPFAENTSTSDMSMYGVNLILELTGKVWLGYAMNYFVESQPIKFDAGDANIAPQSSQTLLLVWNWDRVPIKAIDPKASFFSF
jgi:hypothetical protein